MSNFYNQKKVIFIKEKNAQKQEIHITSQEWKKKNYRFDI